MSDSIKDLCKKYGENVGEPRTRSVGLFTIPEYPEYEEERGMWSTALDAIWTTLRYLAPATLLTLLWGQQSFLFKLLKYIDSAFRALLFSNEEQNKAVLQWLSECGPVRVDELGTVWRHGWILCGVLDAALPGACAGHPPTSLSLKHAQAIAEHYLGVKPVFSRQELEANDNLSRHQEWRLIQYLDSIRQALSKVTPPATKLSQQKISSDTSQFIFDYVARGSGLSVAQINSPTHFKIYPTSQQSLDPGDIKIVIKGPDNTYGLRVLPPILGKAQLIRQQLLGTRTNVSFTENTLPLAHGATYLRNYGKNDMNKTYYIPKTKYDIEIDIESTLEHVKVSYIVKLEGKYEISITSKEQNIVGSPYIVTASKNVIGLLEKESFNLEDGEEIDIVDVKSDRKVVLRIVDFVTEKMLLKENGVLEKISEDEAKYLMENNTETGKSLNLHTETSSNVPMKKNKKFNEVANKILKLNNICKVFNDIRNQNEELLEKENLNNHSRKQQDIPDIVNSTLSEAAASALIESNKRDKFIVPENISVSILTEKSETNVTDNEDNNIQDNINLSELKVLRDVPFDDDGDQKDSVLLSSNPFLNESSHQDNEIEKILNTFVPSEYETNKTQNEETHNNTKILITVDNTSDTVPIIKGNPFIDYDVLTVDRPKSPVFKIISDDATYKRESIYIESNDKDSKNSIENELLNPFTSQDTLLESSTHKTSLPVADFIIGAPVSLPPEIRPLSQETVLKSLDTANIKLPSEDKTQLSKTIPSYIHTEISNTKNDNSMESLCLSVNSDIADYTDEDNGSPKKELWDSAYVSIDENNTLPDNNNNNENNISKDQHHKQKHINSHLFSNMGPAEREIWENCAELQEIESSKLQYDFSKLTKLEVNKTRFTPIIEETDKSISLSTKGTKSEIEKCTETDPVTIAFAEINELYNDYFQDDADDCSTTNEDKDCTDLEIEHKIEYDNEYVNSASVKESDVMRRRIQPEGKISEIQANVTESVSVSQTLQANENDAHNLRNNDPIKFGDNEYSNIVLEKKKYWDEKIKQIEAEESKVQQRKRRLSAKHLRHNDSLSKRRGKQIVKKYLNNNEVIQKQNKISENQERADSKNNLIRAESNENDSVDIKHVKNWKAFWDNKLESENCEISGNCVKTNTLKKQKASSDKESIMIETESTVSNTDSNLETSSSVKQEIPEEVFKAFETSPKRFFGTSRKQILNKLDTFSGKPNTVEEPLINNNKNNYESGLVSSRISLFHNISQTEDLCWAKVKSKSMHNIYQQKYSENAINSSLCKSTLSIEMDDKDNISETQQENKPEQKNVTDKHITIKEKRARVADKFYTQSVDESSYCRIFDNDFPQDSYVKRTIQSINRQKPNDSNYHSYNVRKLSSSKSEMDIFNKFSNKSFDEDLDKYKSCEELPKVSVKNFISLYEDVSKSTETNSTKKYDNKSPEGLEKRFKSASSISGTAGKYESIEDCDVKPKTNNTNLDVIHDEITIKESTLVSEGDSTTSQGTVKSNLCNDNDECKIVTIRDFDKESTYVSLSDIELEIVENRSEKSVETSPERDIEIDPADYKSRFKMARQYFQSLEELREVKKQKQMNECELLLYNKSTESLVEDNQTSKRVKKKLKSHTMPSSQITEFWNQMQEQQNQSNENKPIKISEKFHVEDLFTDVMDGRFSRQGSWRGIPHKKAVLEAFKSMENISDSKLSPYELAVLQLNDFANEKKVQNAQTYLNEYPYLPTTDPSKFHSRLDVNASGLISFKELLNKKDRRNSVPDLRLNPSFTVDL